MADEVTEEMNLVASFRVGLGGEIHCEQGAVFVAALRVGVAERFGVYQRADRVLVVLAPDGGRPEKMQLLEGK